MADDQHIIEIQLHTNMLTINDALDTRDRRRFKLACKHRRDLNAKLARITSAHTTAEV